MINGKREVTVTIADYFDFKVEFKQNITKKEENK